MDKSTHAAWDVSRVAGFVFRLLAGLWLSASASCSPILKTPSRIGLGAFWRAETSQGEGFVSEAVEGCGLVLSRHSLFLGWLSLEVLEIDLQSHPSGAHRVGDRTYRWGDAAEACSFPR